MSIRQRQYSDNSRTENVVKSENQTRPYFMVLEILYNFHIISFRWTEVAEWKPMRDVRRSITKDQPSHYNIGNIGSVFLCNLHNKDYYQMSYFCLFRNSWTRSLLSPLISAMTVEVVVISNDIYSWQVLTIEIELHSSNWNKQ